MENWKWKIENFGREESFAQNKLHIPDRIRIDLYCKLLYKQNSIKEQNLYGRISSTRTASRRTQLV